MSQHSYYAPDIALDDTIVSRRFISIQMPQEEKEVKKDSSSLPLIFLFLTVALLSGTGTFLTKFIMSRAPMGCVESVYSLKPGQNVSCNDPRARINVLSNLSNDPTFICKCSKENP